jgi:hypothetical protein
VNVEPVVKNHGCGAHGSALGTREEQKCVNTVDANLEQETAPHLG